MGGDSVTHHIDTIRREMVKAIATVEIARLRKPVAMCWNKPVQPPKKILVSLPPPVVDARKMVDLIFSGNSHNDGK
jgi:hypothetical protein